MIWGILRQLGDQVPAIPTGGNEYIDSLKYRRTEIDLDELRRLSLKAENNNRAAILLAVIEGDDL